MLAHKNATQYSCRELSGHKKTKQKSLNYMLEADFCRDAQRGVCMPDLPSSQQRLLQNLGCGSQSTLSC